MRKRSRPRTMSHAVRERIKERTRRRVRALLNWIWAVSFSFVCIFGGWQQHLLVKRQNAAAGLDFHIATAGGTKENILAFTVDGVPAIVVINGEQWEIKRVSYFNDIAGHKPGDVFHGTQAETYCKQHLIAYIETQNPVVLRINLTHEIFHAGDCLHGGDTWWNSINPTRDVHPGVTHLGEFVSTFMHDNPEFAAWLTQ